jgi:hypothetical protein
MRMGLTLALLLLGLFLAGCDPYIFTITNRSDQPVTVILRYEQPDHDKGANRLEPGQGRTVGAWEFPESRFARIEATNEQGERITCHRYTLKDIEALGGRVVITADGSVC